jgi:hypothetical protein
MPLDKKKHLIVGFLLVFTGLPWLPLLAGIGKELWDKWSGKGTPEWADLAYTLAGGYCGLLVLGML